MGGYIMLWIIVAGIALGIDIATSSFLFIWFTVSGIISMILAIVGFSFSTQLIVFIALSAILIAFCYPYVKKTIKKTVPNLPTMEKSYIGKEFICPENIDDKATIKYQGIYWTVKNQGEYIHQGDRVKIIGVEGNKLLLKKISKENLEE